MQTLDELTDNMLLARRAFTGNPSDENQLRYDQARNTLVEFLVQKTPYVTVTTKRTYRKYSGAIREHTPYLDYDDMLGIAYEATIDAVCNFDPDRGKPISSWVIDKVKSAVETHNRRRVFGKGSPYRQKREQFMFLPAPINEKYGSKEDGPVWTPALEGIADATADPWYSVERSIIRDAVEQLPPVHRAIVEKVVFEGCTFKEAAASVGGRVGRTSAFKIFREAKDMLRNALPEFGDVDAVDTDHE